MNNQKDIVKQISECKIYLIESLWLIFYKPNFNRIIKELSRKNLKKFKEYLNYRRKKASIFDFDIKKLNIRILSSPKNPWNLVNALINYNLKRERLK